MLGEFDLVIPDDLAGALKALDDGMADDPAGGGGAPTVAPILPLAGGTNLLVDIRARRVAPGRLVALTKVARSPAIDAGNDRVSLGLGATVGDVLRHPHMAVLAPSLYESARVFGGQMVRNAATVAGNVCSASPAADTVPPLLTLDAELTLAGPSGRRTVALDQFYPGLKTTALKRGELVTEISWTPPADRTANLFYKLARRFGDAITVVGVAVSVTNHGGRCADVRIALGSVAPTVFRPRDAEAMVQGQPLTSRLADAAAERAMEESSPIDDVRASAEYRRHCVHVLVRRLLNRAWEKVQ